METVIAPEVFERAKKVRWLMLDVDGVMTDGQVLFDYEGNEIKAFNVRDGHGIKLVMRTGIDVAILTGRQSEAVSRRAEELGITEVYQRVYNKVEVYGQMAAELGIRDEQVCFVGDDLVDLPLLRRVGFAVAVADAIAEVRGAAHYVTGKPGGQGAVREVCELLLRAQGTWDEVTSRYR
jgi:3-deoxy-D-manno-octulosonate 8-phosphate phosphatase (KDO 8-P phosphatase)